MELENMNEDTRKEIISVQISPPEETQESYIKPTQSANALFNFMKKLEFLKAILKKRAIIPRYFEENITYLGLEYNKIAFPMTCFCDIILQKIEPHTQEYGKFGVGLHKEWCINNKVQPIHYINKHSEISKDFKMAFESAVSSQVNDKDFENLKDYLLMHLFYMKPLDGEMKREDKNKHLNFHDEREWRFIPNISETNLPQILLKERNTLKSQQLYSDALTMVEGTWLKFEYENIKYLIVDNNASKLELIRFIMSGEINTSLEGKYLIVSKIIVFDEINEDW